MLRTTPSVAFLLKDVHLQTHFKMHVISCAELNFRANFVFCVWFMIALWLTNESVDVYNTINTFKHNLCNSYLWRMRHSYLWRMCHVMRFSFFRCLCIWFLIYASSAVCQLQGIAYKYKIFIRDLVHTMNNFCLNIWCTGNKYESNITCKVNDNWLKKSNLPYVSSVC